MSKETEIRDLEYSLAKQIPDMKRGVRISTNYGELVIDDARACREIEFAVHVSVKSLIERLKNESSAN